MQWERERQWAHYSSLEKDYHLQLFPCSNGLCLLVKFPNDYNMRECANTPHEHQAGLNPDARPLPPSTSEKDPYILWCLTASSALRWDAASILALISCLLAMSSAVTWLTSTSLFRSRVFWSMFALLSSILLGAYQQNWLCESVKAHSRSLCACIKLSESTIILS